MTEQDISARAAARAEAMVYSINNTYLSPTQKAMVEAVYQFPLGIMGIAFSLLTLIADQSILTGYLNASFIGGLAWVAARFLPGRLFFIPISLITGGWGQLLIQLGFAAYALVEHRWALAAILGLSAFGIMSVIELPMWLWGATKSGMNAKYQIAKRLFGTVFPFESAMN